MDGAAKNLLSFALDNERLTTWGKLNRWVVTNATQDLRGGVIVIVRGGVEESREEKVANEKAADYHCQDLHTKECVCVCVVYCILYI